MKRRSPAIQVSRADIETLAAFRYAVRRFLHFSTRAARAAGLSAPQHQALLAIKGFSGRGAISVGELAERLDRRPHSTVELVNRLARRKWVTRSPGREDRRRVHLRLTSAGEAILDRLSVAHRDELRLISPELRTLLEKLAGKT